MFKKYSKVLFPLNPYLSDVSFEEGRLILTLDPYHHIIFVVFKLKTI